MIYRTFYALHNGFFGFALGHIITELRGREHPKGHEKNEKKILDLDPVPDHYQNLITSKLGHDRPLVKISLKSVENFLRYPAFNLLFDPDLDL